MGRGPNDTNAVSTRKAWLHPPGLIFLIVIAMLLVFDVIQLLYPYPWSGFSTYTKTTKIQTSEKTEQESREQESREEVPGKTLWDWLDLLIVPATLVVGGYLLNNAQKWREEDIADRRIKEDRDIAEQRTQETALQTYLDQMGNLLIEKELSSNKTPGVNDLAKVWTLTVVRRVNPERKGIVVRFLYESNLIQGDTPIVSLAEANLRKADLSLAFLSLASLGGADLNGANLNGANLSKADLSGADLKGANLNGANLSKADLSGAFLNGADLSEANLSEANLSEANLSKVVYTKDTIWPAVFDPIRAGTIEVESP